MPECGVMYSDKCKKYIYCMSYGYSVFLVYVNDGCLIEWEHQSYQQTSIISLRAIAEAAGLL